MKSVESIIARKEIFEKLETGINEDISFDDSRINHERDLDKVSKKIVFNRKCYDKIMELSKQVMHFKNQERGVFFYGRIMDDFFYIEDFGCDFALADGIFENGAVEMNGEPLNEMKKLTNKKDNQYDLVMHFHIHPSYVGRTYEDNNKHSLLYSDQDYLAYGWLQKECQPNTNHQVLFLGGLVSINYGKSPRFAVVCPDMERETFLNFTDLYYINNNQLNRFNRFNIFNNHPEPIANMIKVVNSICAYKDTNKKEVK